MKIKIELITVEEGIPKVIELFDVRYFLQKIENKEESESSVTEKKQKIQNFEKGKLLGVCYHSKLYSNVFEAVREHLKEPNNTFQSLKDVIRPYYEGYTEGSIKTVASLYKGVVQGRYKLSDKKAPKPKSKPKTQPLVTLPNKGRLLRRIKNVMVYQNILNDIKNKIDAGSRNREVLVNVLKEYYPNLKRQTLNKYIISYFDYLDYQGINIEFFRGQRKKRKTNKQSYRRGVRPPTSDSIGYSKKYKTWIKKGEIDEVRRVINMTKYGYTTTMNNMHRESKVSSKDRMRAVIDFLMDQGKVERRYIDSEFIYNWVL